MQINRIFKYLVCALVIHSTIAYLPREPIPFEESLIIVLLCVSMLFIIDCINGKKEFFTEHLNNNNTLSSELLSLAISNLDGKVNNKLLDEMKNECTNEDKCNKLITKFKKTNKISKNDELKIKLYTGYTKYLPLTNLLNDNVISEKQAMDVVYAMETNSDVILETVLNKLLRQNVISSIQREKIILLSNFDDDYNKSRQILANKIYDDQLSLENAHKINSKCSDSNVNECSDHLQKMVKDKILNETDAVSLIQGYSRPGDYNENRFGSMSDETAYNENESNYQNAEFDNKNKDEEKEKEKKDMKLFDSEFKDEEKVDEFLDGDDNYIDIQNPGTQSITYEDTTEKYSGISDLGYSQINPLVPLGKYSKNFTNKWDHGFSYLQTHKWRPPEYEVQSCKIEEKCDICDQDDNYPVELPNFDKSRKVKGPDHINSDYVNDKLNTGRA